MPHSKELTRHQVSELLRTIQAASPGELDDVEQSIQREFGSSPAQRLANELALRDLREAIAARRGIEAGPPPR